MTTLSASRKASRFARIVAYLNGTYPPVPMLVAAILAVVSIYFTLEALQARGPLVYTWRAVGVGFTFFLLTGLMRVYDELKDVESDRRLAAEGDPKYLTRPIVTGAIDVEDMLALRSAIVVLTLAMNVFLGPALFAACAGAYLIAWMSSRWFFWPPMGDHLLLAFVTHNPMTTVFNAYVLVGFSQDLGFAGLPVLSVCGTLLARQAVVSAWELARKIRAPEDETQYSTYSKVLGWRVAPLLTIGAVIVATASAVWVGLLANLGPLYSLVATAAALVPIAALLRFRFAPSTKTAKLQLPVEIFAGIESLAVLVALIARWGLVLTPIH